MTSGLVIPALALALMGWLVPKLLSLVWPEGVRPLIWLGVVSALAMLVLSMMGFAVLYASQGVPFMAMAGPDPLAALWHFLKLGGASALIWGPILALSVAGLPKHWTTRTW